MTAPIPPSYYQRSPGNVSPPSPPTGDGTPPNRPGPREPWRAIPGFRTGRRWKQVVAVIGYLIIAVWLVQIGTNPGLGIFGLLSLSAVWLGTNAFGIRTKIPVFRSPNPLAAGGAW